MSHSSERTGRIDEVNEEMLRMVLGLFLSPGPHVPRQVVFCGIGQDNGSASVCAAVGRTLAGNISRPVCLVDANLRSPRLSSLLSVNSPLRSSEKKGSDETGAIRDQCVQIKENLWFAGPGLLADEEGAYPSASRIRQLLIALRKGFEFVLIDAPRADIGGDAPILAQVSDGAILVIEAEADRRIVVRKVKEAFDAASVTLLGTVLRNRSFPIPKGLYDRL